MTKIRSITTAAFCVGMAVVACTPATQDPPATGAAGATGPAAGSTGTTGAGGTAGIAGASGNAGSSGNAGAMAGASGSVGGDSNVTGAAGTTGAGGSGGVGPTGAAGSASAGTTGTGGASSGAAGNGAAGASGGVTGAAGAQGTGGTGTASTGCNWVHNTANDTWAMNPAPADKVVLFNGSTLAGWHKLNMPGVPISWKLIGDGTMEVVPSGTGQATEVQSDMKFDDVCVHVEYMTPTFPSNVDVQKQGNSGVYLKSAYEMQILDTHSLPPLIDGCGAVYKVAPPLVVACNQYLVWNTYEIEFKSSVWAGTPAKKTKDAVFVQVTLNGKVVQKNIALNPAGGFTQAGIPDAAGPQPLGLQDHLDLVRFRNIWVTIPKN